MYNTESIRQIDWTMIEPEALGGELAEDLITVINRSIRYLAGRWWYQRGFDKEAGEQYLSMKGGYDKVVRPAIFMAKTLAFALAFGVYDESVVHIPQYELRDKFIKVVRSCAYRHIANVQDGWGGEEESISHVYELTLTAWVAWDKLNSRDKEYVVNALEYELSKLYKAEPRYYYTESGMPVDRGVSTVYYNTAVANLMQLAVNMMPEHSRVAEMIELRDRFYAAIYAVHGKTEQNGGNVSTDYVLYSYGVRSAAAMTYIGTVAKSCILSCLAGEEIMPVIADEYDDIYKAFYKTKKNEKGLPEGEFVCYDGKGRPTDKIKNTDGGRQNAGIEGQAYLTDIVAFCSGVSTDSEYTPRDWARVRMKRVLSRQKSGARGYCIQAPQFMRGSHGECICSQLTDAYVLLFFYVVNKSSVNNKYKYIDS